ncbi:MAG: hypothetical protein M1815_004475 [Lichina confinis]|nr:MAG: hypothetical protein M1815_004475 [Lichina confinis]
MTDSVKDSTWLLTEHLRYTPLSLIDDIINSVNALLYRAVSAVESGLLNAAPATLGFLQPATRKRGKDQGQDQDDDENDCAAAIEAKREIENGVHQLETLFEATVDKDFDKFEIYVLRNILTVSDDVLPWMRLGHYENFDLTPNPDAPTLETLIVQRRKLQEAQKLQRDLVQETRRNAVLIEQLRGLLSAPAAGPSSAGGPSSASPSVKQEQQGQDAADGGSTADSQSSPLAFLTSHPETVSLAMATAGSSTLATQPLTTSTSFIVSQLPGLRTLLADLRPRLSTLSSAGPPPPPLSSSQYQNPTHGPPPRDPTRDPSPAAAAAAQDARTHYIESEARRHLTTRQGLALDALGAVSDAAEWHDPGRRIGPEEVRGLEEVVRILRAARREREAGGGGGEGGGGGGGGGGEGYGGGHGGEGGEGDDGDAET